MIIEICQNNLAHLMAQNNYRLPVYHKNIIESIMLHPHVKESSLSIIEGLKIVWKAWTPCNFMYAFIVSALN